MITEILSDVKQSMGFADRCYLEQKDNSAIKVIFDSVDSESWSGSTSVSNHAVERGQDISDHIKLNPETVSISATLTNHTGISSMNPVSLARIYGLKNVEDLVNARLEILDQWRKEGTLLRYYGAVKENVENMVITSMTPSKSSDSGDAAGVQINLQKVVIAEYLETSISSSLPGAAKATIKKGLVKKIKQVVDFSF